MGQTRFQDQGKNTVSSITGSYKSAVSKHAHRFGFDFHTQGTGSPLSPTMRCPTISGWCNPRHAMHGVAMLTQPDQSGWLGAGACFNRRGQRSPVFQHGVKQMGAAHRERGGFYPA